MNPIGHLIRGRPTDLGGLQVKRVLPSAVVPTVGPFVFVDHMGPVQFAAGNGIDVRPHPHIGLATVTYLFEGEFLHRDSLGTEQRIVPGDVNWMIAGRGIVHSERTPAQVRARSHRAHGVQTWVALPDDHEDAAPAFEHHPAPTLPQFTRTGAIVRVIAGHAFGHRAPVGVLSPTLYCAVEMQGGGALSLGAEHEERAVYVIEGAVRIDGQSVEAGTLAVLTTDHEITISAEHPSRMMLLGGAAISKRHVVWNFVASSRARIEVAQQEWLRYESVAQRNRFGTVPGESEFIPLPQK